MFFIRLCHLLDPCSWFSLFFSLPAIATVLAVFDVEDMSLRMYIVEIIKMTMPVNNDGQLSYGTSCHNGVDAAGYPLSRYLASSMKTYVCWRSSMLLDFHQCHSKLIQTIKLFSSLPHSLSFFTFEAKSPVMVYVAGSYSVLMQAFCSSVCQFHCAHKSSQLSTTRLRACVPVL